MTPAWTIANLRRAGIQVHADSDLVPTACALLAADGYHIHVSAALAADEACLEAVLAHEAAHVFRGDCLALGDGVDRARANQAMDALINRHVDLAAIARAVPGEYVTLEALRAACPGIPILPSGWRQVYELLGKLEGPISAQSFDLAPGMAPGMQPAEAQTQHAVMQATAIAAGFAAAVTPGRYALPPSAPPNPALLRLARIVRAVMGAGFEGLRCPARTYSRPGRLPMLRGSTRRPQLRVCLLVDVSESMRCEWGGALAAARVLARQNLVRVVLWSDAATAPLAHIPRLEDIATGGGTRLAPAIKSAAQWPHDVTVIFTDGELADKPAVPGPVVWVLPSGASPRDLPLGPRHRVVEEGGGDANA